MIFDVIIREGFNEENKPVLMTRRVHDSTLSNFVRDVQDSGKYVFGIIPLFKSKIVHNGNRETFDSFDGCVPFNEG